jgi:hypothetical protein
MELLCCLCVAFVWVLWRGVELIGYGLSVDQMHGVWMGSLDGWSSFFTLWLWALGGIGYRCLYAETGSIHHMI